MAARQPRRRKSPSQPVAVLTHLGKLSVARFMREYWQRRPLLLRGAFADFAPPVKRAGMFALAARDEVESRLVVHDRRGWSLRQGPIPRRCLPPLRQSRWTLLVQGLDLVDAGARELLSRFRFVPDARLDDLMASFATDGGGVGPHADNYDVFLLQVHGRRRWRISHQRDLRVLPGKPLRLLADFRPSHEWVVGPGDLLYLPPGVAHDGVALGECLTYSIGFRTPTFEELHDPWLTNFAEHTSLPGRYADPGLRPTRHPGVLPAAMVRNIHRALIAQRPSRTDTERFLLEYLSEPKPHVVFRPRRTGPAAFAREARRQGVRLDLRSRLLIGASAVGCNGEAYVANKALQPVLRALADRRMLYPAQLGRAPIAVMALLHEWHDAGWLQLGVAP
jgi:50S ribosomal protein L16 3-hydroxylase